MWPRLAVIMQHERQLLHSAILPPPRGGATEGWSCPATLFTLW
jgi:hypothetical protein